MKAERAEQTLTRDELQWLQLYRKMPWRCRWHMRRFVAELLKARTPPDDGEQLTSTTNMEPVWRELKGGAR